MMNNIDFKIRNENCYIIAEAGLNHNGSIEIAKKLIDVAVESGCDAVKFQKRHVDGLATKEILDSKDDRFPDFGTTYREIREHLEFNFNEFQELKLYSERKKIDFICTAFDIESVDFLEKLGLEAYKIASHGMTNLNLLRYLSKLNKPVIISTGMATMEEVDRAIKILIGGNVKVYLMHCVSSYPTPYEECNLKMIEILSKKFKIPVGYSGHEIGYLPSLVAVSKGALLVERHHTLDKNMVGFDHKLSLEPKELKEMVDGIRDIKKISGDGTKFVSDKEMITRHKYHVSMISSRSLKKGEILTSDMICYKNPGTGIPPKDETKYLGKIIKYNIEEDVLLDSNMFE